MQRVLVVLEYRHNLLHLRASRERKWSQPRRHSMYIGLSLNSKLCHQEVTTSWPHLREKIHNKKNIIKPIIWNKRCIKKGYKWIHDRFLKDPEFCASSSNMIELKRSVSRWMSLQTRTALITWRNQNFSIQTELVDLSQEVWKHWTIEKSFWF